MRSVLHSEKTNKKALQKRKAFLLVTQVSQTWNSLVEGLEQIEAAVEGLLNEEGL